MRDENRTGVPRIRKKITDLSGKLLTNFGHGGGLIIVGNTTTSDCGSRFNIIGIVLVVYNKG